LPRQRVTDEKITGVVVDWKGKYGWIMPAAPVQHPKAFKHQGKIFISITDLDGHRRYLNPGMMCEFYVFEDEAGLGAEQCIPVERPPRSKGGKADASSIAQIGGSRPSNERSSKGGNRKGASKGGSGKPGGNAQDAVHSGLAADLGSFQKGRGSGRGRGGYNPSGRGQGEPNGKGRGFENGFTNKGKKGGFPAPEADAIPSFGGLRQGVAGAGAIGSSSIGSWDAFNNQRVKGQRADLSEPFGREAALPQSLPSFMDHSRLNNSLASYSQQAQASSLPQDSLLSQNLFVDNSRGMPMVGNAGLDPQTLQFMRSMNMPPPMAGSSPGLSAPGFGAPLAGAGMIGATAMNSPAYTGIPSLDMDGLANPLLGGFAMPGGNFPAAAPPVNMQFGPIP
jgi:hypothetical protein